MTKITFILLTIIIPVFVFGQNIDVARNGTVTVDGKDVFKIEGKMGMVNTNFTVYNMAGEELLAADGQNNNNFMTVTFSSSNASLDYPLNFGVKKLFAKELVRMKVIKDGKLNPDGVKRLVAKYNGRADQDMVLTENNTRNTLYVNLQPTLVQRNRHANILVDGYKVTQDAKVIGTIEGSQETSNGTVIDNYVVKNLDGQLIAKASKAMNSTTIEFVTYDNKKFNVEAPSKNINSISLSNFILKTLVDRGLL